MRVISVLVAGREFLCGAIWDILDKCSDIDVIGSAQDPVEAVSNVMLLEPDVVLLDVRMLLHDRSYITRELKFRAPGCKIVIWAEDESDKQNLTGLSEFDGYVCLGTSRGFLADAVRATANGGMWLDPQLSREFLARKKPDMVPHAVKPHESGSQRVMKRLDHLFTDDMTRQLKVTYDGFDKRPYTPVGESAAIEQRLVSAAMSGGLVSHDGLEPHPDHPRRRRNHIRPGQVGVFILATTAACVLLFFLLGFGASDKQADSAPGGDQDITVIRYRGTTFVPYPVFYPGQNGGGSAASSSAPAPAPAPAPMPTGP